MRTATVLKNVRAGVFAFLFVSASIAQANFVQNYNYPLSHSLKSTVASSHIVPPAGAVSQSLKVQVAGETDGRARKDLKLTMFPASGSTSVVFVLVGLGGVSKTPMAQYVASVIQASGKTAVIIPNSMTKEFVLSASSTGVVGDVNRDANDTYVVLQSVVAALQAQGLPVSSVSVLGYSLGGLLASRIAEIDARERRLNIQSTLLINPPVNLLQGMQTLDAYYAQFKSMGLGTLMGLASKVKKFLELLVGAPEKAESVAMSDRELQGAIGYSMRESFDDMILATQSIHDLGILPQVAADRASAAKKIGFEEYTTKILAPSIGPAATLPALASQSSLRAQAGFLSSASNVFILHNANDFLMSPSDVQFIESTFGSRARIYPTGGHMGNLDFADNLNAIRNWLSGAAIN